MAETMMQAAWRGYRPATRPRDIAEQHWAWLCAHVVDGTPYAVLARQDGVAPGVVRDAVRRVHTRMMWLGVWGHPLPLRGPR